MVIMSPTQTGSAKGDARVRVNKRLQLHLLHGDDEAAIENCKQAIVEAHLTQEEREENYREIVPSGSPPTLRRVLGELVAELSTVSFLPGAKRVVTLYPVQDFFEARAAKSKAAKSREAKVAAGDAPKRTSSEHLAEFIEKELPHLPAVLIVIVTEDYEKWKRISAKNPVVELAAKLGGLQAFKETGPQFAFFDALFARKTPEAIELWREWLTRTGASPKPYQQLATQMRLLLQAKTASSDQLRKRGISNAQFANDFMPDEWDKNLFALKPEWRQEKLVRAAANFTFTELIAAYEKLDEIQKYAIPLNSDPFVPDKALLAELWITELTVLKN
jgi:hypothetical protein